MMIRLRWITVLAAIFAFSLLLPAVGSADILSPVADAYVWQTNPNQNYGSATALFARAYSTDYRHSFLKFDLDVPTGYKVATADLWLYVRSNTVASTGAVYYIPDSSWTEGTITWTSALSLPVGSLMDTEQIAIVGGTAPGVWVDFDLLANGASLNDGLLSVMIRMATEPTAGLTTFDSRHASNTSLRPYLEYTLEAVPVPPTVLLLGSGILGLAILRRKQS